MVPLIWVNRYFIIPGRRTSVSSSQQPRVPVQQEHVGPRRTGLRLRHDVRTNVEPHQRTSARAKDTEWPSGLHPRIISGTMAAPISLLMAPREKSYCQKVL